LQIHWRGFAGLRFAGWHEASGRDTQGNYCTSCYTGVYPTDLVQLQVRENHASGKNREAMGGDSVKIRIASIPWRWNMKAEAKRSKEAQPSVPDGPARAARGHRVVLGGAVFLLINGTIGQARVIPSGSMEDTLLIGDHLIMSRIGYDAGVPFTNWHVPLWRNPHRQQVIIFKPPFAAGHSRLREARHRFAGRFLEIHDGSVWVNGQRLKETTLPDAPSPTTCASPSQCPPTVIFCMGDNRATLTTAVFGAACRATTLSERR